MAAPNQAGLSGAVKLVVKTFLDQKHYQLLHDLLSDKWSHCHSLTAAMRLMEAHGVFVPPDQEARLALLPEDKFIDALVMRMPQQSREQFEHFFLQLSLIASTTTRLRSALETGNSGAVEEVLESAENVGILQFILKMAVAQAGQEVKSHVQDHDSWVAVTSDRLGPLLQSQANALISAKALEDAKHQLEAHHSSASDKTKKMLMSIAGNSLEAIKAMSFNSWRELIKEMKIEAEIRLEYAEEIDAAEQKLTDYITKQTGIMRSMINKRAGETTEDLLRSCFQAFVDEVGAKYDALAKEEEMKALNAKMANFSKEQSAKSKAFMARLNSGNKEGLMALCWAAWMGAMAEAVKNKEMEAAVKKSEEKMAEFMKRANEGAKAVLGSISGSTDTGLMSMCWKAWVQFIDELKEALRMEEMIAQGRGRFNTFNGKNKASALSATERKAKADEDSTAIVIFWYWKRETKVELMRRYAKDKNMKKKQQLVGVKGLFKNFANELEAGLKEGTPRVEPGSSPPKKKSGRSRVTDDGSAPA